MKGKSINANPWANPSVRMSDRQMNSLNQTPPLAGCKTVYPASGGAEVAGHKLIATFRAVCSITRGNLSLRASGNGGLPPRNSVLNIMRNSYFITCLVLLLLCGCASQTTTAWRSTGTVRNSSVEERSAEARFHVLQGPSATSPDLSISVSKQVTRENTFERRFAEKRILKPVTRTLLWLGGTTVAAGGYYLMTNTGLVRLGQLTTGAGILVPLSSEIITASLPPVGEEWKSESRILPTTILPVAATDVVASAGDSSWAI